MRNSIRLSLGALVLAASAACSSPSEQPAVSGDLERDLARAGGADVQLAGSSANRIDIVSASERIENPVAVNVPDAKSKTVARAASTKRGRTAVVKSERKVAPAAQAPAPTPAPAPTEVLRPEPEPERTPQPRPQVPVPSRQPEPRGGWKTPGEIIRNAPFPINP